MIDLIAGEQTRLHIWVVLTENGDVKCMTSGITNNGENPLESASRL